VLAFVAPAASGRRRQNRWLGAARRPLARRPVVRMELLQPGTATTVRLRTGSSPTRWAFATDIAENAPAADKGRALARAMQRTRTLLVLDGWSLQ
jgi:hypothetical protein